MIVSKETTVVLETFHTAVKNYSCMILLQLSFFTLNIA
jgi:hypothetical protein